LRPEEGERVPGKNQGPVHRVETGVSLRRAIGVWGSFTWGYADVGADIYVALGLVMAYGKGLTPLAFALAGSVYVLIGLAYTELAAAYPVAGGGQYYTLRGLGDFPGFLAGWALLLDFTLDVALFALASAGYLSYFLPALKQKVSFPVDQPWLILTAGLIIVFLLLLNVRGIKESSRVNEVLGALDMLNESAICLFGFLFAFKPDLFLGQVTGAIPGSRPSGFEFMLASTLAIISFVGLESISQAAEETVRPASVVPRTSKALIVTVLIYALSFSTMGLGVTTWEQIAARQEDPVAFLARLIPFLGIIAGPFAAILGATLLFISANTGVMGSSRIAWSMATFRLMPAWFAHVHPVWRTPSRTIWVFGGVGLAWLFIAGLSENALHTLGNMYAFGATAGYILVFLSLIVLRFKDPYTPRPFKVPGNFRVRWGGEEVDFPALGVLGILGVSSIFFMVVLTHTIGRVAGPGWLVLGTIIYAWFRKRSGYPVFGTLPRDWEQEQMKVLADAKERDALEEYRRALERRERKRAPEARL
jgi:APA family basic amino acid/polyamine antiporter